MDDVEDIMDGPSSSRNDIEDKEMKMDKGIITSRSTTSDDYEAACVAENTFLMTSYLDEMEDRIDILRRQASSLLQERDSLLTILSNMKSECSSNLKSKDPDDMILNIGRLEARCESVHISVLTVRSTEQSSCFTEAGNLVSCLEHKCILGDQNTDDYKKVAKSYLNACLSEAISGPVDYKFQKIILGCTVEDQKMFRRRLECLVQGQCHVDFVQKLITNLKIEETDHS